MDTISNSSYWYIGMMEQVECEQEIFMSLIESKYYEVNGIIQEGFSFKEAKQKIINAFKKMIQFFKNVFINIKYALKKKRLGITTKLDERIKLAKKIIKDNPNFQQTEFVDYNKELKDSDADKLIKITTITGKIVEKCYNKYKPNEVDNMSDNLIFLYNSINELIGDFVSDIDETKHKKLVDSINKTIANNDKLKDEDYEGLIDIIIKKVKFIREDLPLYMDDIVYSIVAEKSGIGDTLSNIGNIIHNKKEQELNDLKNKKTSDIEVKDMPMSSKADNLGKNTGIIKSVYDVDTLGSQCKRLLANNTSYEIALEKMQNTQERILKSIDNTRDMAEDAGREYIRLLDITYSAINATYIFLNSVIDSVLKIYSYLLSISLNDLNVFIGVNDKDNYEANQYGYVNRD